MTVEEPRGVRFMNELNGACDLLETDPTGVIWLLKTVFVGHGIKGGSEFSDYIVNLRPLEFVMYNVTGTFDVTGGVYEIEFVGANNGAARLPQYSRVAKEISFTPDDKTLNTSMQTLIDLMNKKSKGNHACVIEALKKAYDFADLKKLNQFRVVEYRIVLEDPYKSSEYEIDGWTDLEKDKTTGQGILKFGIKSTVEQAIRSIMNRCSRVKKDLTEGDENGIRYSFKHFTTEIATQNLISESARTMFRFTINETSSEFIQAILKTLNLFLAYLGKILYPRTFSFLSIPKIIVIPAIITSIQYFKKNLKNKKVRQLILPLLLWSYFAFFIVRVAMGRYLFPITPVIVFFFIIFLRDGLSKKLFSKRILLVSAIFVLFGLYFEIDYLLIKVSLNLILFGILFLGIYWKKINSKVFSFITVLSFSFISLSVSLFFNYSNGQIHQALSQGKNWDIEKINEKVPSNSSIVINDIGWGKLPFFLRKDTDANPEWKWVLKSYVPKKKLLKNMGHANTYYLLYNTANNRVNQLGRKLQINNAEKVILLTSNNESTPFLMQNQLEVLKAQNWLLLEDVIELKGKKMYLFTVQKEILKATTFSED